MDTNGLIDNRNLELWNYLNKVTDIEIRNENRSEYLTYSKGGKSIIFIPLSNIDSASFTHELLHIYLRIKKVFIGAGLAISINESKKLSRIFSEDLIAHIGNCLEHIKMLPEFINLGYEEKDFLSDYSVNKLTDEVIFKIEENYTTTIQFDKIYNASAIDFFIGKYFAAKCCPNKTFDYQTQLIKLEKIDPELFQILETFLKEWMNFDYNSNDPIKGSYHWFMFNFIENLEKWTEDRIIK